MVVVYCTRQLSASTEWPSLDTLVILITVYLCLCLNQFQNLLSMNFFFLHCIALHFRFRIKMRNNKRRCVYIYITNIFSSHEFIKTRECFFSIPFFCNSKCRCRYFVACMAWGIITLCMSSPQNKTWRKNAQYTEQTFTQILFSTTCNSQCVPEKLLIELREETRSQNSQKIFKWRL